MQSSAEAALEDLRKTTLSQVRELHRSRSSARLNPDDRRRQLGLNIVDEIALKQYVQHKWLLYGADDDAKLLKYLDPEEKLCKELPDACAPVPYELADEGELYFEETLSHSDIIADTTEYGRFEGIYLQCECDPWTLGFVDPSADVDTAPVYISRYPGILLFLRKQLEWHGIPLSSTSTIEHAQTILYHQIRLTSAIILPTINPHHRLEDTIWAFYVYTREAVFVFAPFKQVEIERIVECAMLRFVRAQDLVKQILIEKRLSVKSQCTLPPLQTTADLHRLLTLLTSGRIAETYKKRRKQKSKITVNADIYNSLWMRMHMLWTSCRAEYEVSKEAIRFLKALWETQPDDVLRFNALLVLDNILDPNLMHPSTSDLNFATLQNWLTFLEESVSPYKSNQVLQLVDFLLRRIRRMGVRSLYPISHTALKKFEMLTEWEEFVLAVEEAQRELAIQEEDE